MTALKEEIVHPKDPTAAEMQPTDGPITDGDALGYVLDATFGVVPGGYGVTLRIQATSNLVADIVLANEDAPRFVALYRIRRIQDLVQKPCWVKVVNVSPTERQIKLLGFPPQVIP